MSASSRRANSLGGYATRAEATQDFFDYAEKYYIKGSVLDIDT